MNDLTATSQIRIQRPFYEHHELRNTLSYENVQNSPIIDVPLDKQKIISCIKNSLPVTKWLRDYSWKRDIVGDLISGFTVAVMHIPQGMAYALLGNVPPVTGIYMALFPVLVYFFFGTSLHNSMGTFAVVCLMTGKVVLENSDPYYLNTNPLDGKNNSFQHDTNSTGLSYKPIEVACAVTFTVAIIQLIMFVFRMGIVRILLSETLVSGFTTGAAIHVFISQIKDLLGLRLPKFKGYFVNIYAVKAIFENADKVNLAAVSISVTTVVIIVINNEFLKPLVAKKSRIPIPIELIAVVTGTVISKTCLFQSNYNIQCVGEIPTGFPQPEVPTFSLMPNIIVDALTIAIVSYTITLSMGMIFAQKLNYEVDANQELLAMGAGNTVGSFFSCMPFCASLSRSQIQQIVGGKSQIASIVSCSILLMVLLWIGPFFETLPKSVLASIIVTALKGMLMQITDLFKFWKLSKMDALVWIITFFSVVFISIDIGLLIGILTSLATIIILGFRPHTCLLGSVQGTDIYLDITRYKQVREIEGIKIFSYSGALNFATKNIFKTELIKLIKINPHEVLRHLSKKSINGLYGNTATKNVSVDGIDEVENRVRTIIVDFSCISYVDPSSVQMLKSLIQSFQQINISIYIAACSDPVYETLKRCELIKEIDTIVRIFPSIHDAVYSSKNSADLSFISI